MSLCCCLCVFLSPPFNQRTSHSSVNQAVWCWICDIRSYCILHATPANNVSCATACSKESVPVGVSIHNVIAHLSRAPLLCIHVPILTHFHGQGAKQRLSIKQKRIHDTEFKHPIIPNVLFTVDK